MKTGVLLSCLSMILVISKTFSEYKIRTSLKVDLGYSTSAPSEHSPSSHGSQSGSGLASITCSPNELVFMGIVTLSPQFSVDDSLAAISKTFSEYKIV
jgi:hypothetical protein